MKKHVQSRHVAGVAPLGRGHTKLKPPLLGGMQLKESIVIDRAPSVCYAFWRDFKNLPSFMQHLESVIVLDDWRSHWMVEAPADTTAEWDAEIIEDIPDQRISWRSLEDAQIDNAGSVQFVPLEDGRRTEVKVSLTYNPPLGKLGDALSTLFGENPAEELADDLQEFKELMEETER
jgi:uncharacterized membrane protein